MGGVGQKIWEVLDRKRGRCWTEKVGGVGQKMLEVLDRKRGRCRTENRGGVGQRKLDLHIYAWELSHNWRNSTIKLPVFCENKNLLLLNLK